MSDLRRTFEYHGAEHKTISCYEAEDELTRAGESSTRASTRAAHQLPADRDGAGDLQFFAARTAAWYWLVASRIVGIPVIAGLSYE